MRAILDIPDQLIDDLIRETKAKSKTQAIILAIEDYLRQRRLEKLLALQGKLEIEENWRELENLELQELIHHG